MMSIVFSSIESEDNVTVRLFLIDVEHIDESILKLKEKLRKHEQLF